MFLTACGSSVEVPSSFSTCADPKVLCIDTSGAATCHDLTVETDNCGACGNVCPVPLNGGAAACSAGKCVPSCTGGATWQLCNGVPASGGSTTTLPDGGTVTTGGGGAAQLSCTDTATDFQNCGACGTVCKVTESCQGGTCQPKNTDPNAGTTLCDIEADGGTIYHDLNIDPANCGACGHACAATDICQSGECKPCGVAVCNNTCVDTKTDPNNCGACGNVVTTGGCDNGTPRASIDGVFGLPASTGNVPGSPSTSFTQYITISSATRIAKVQFEYKWATTTTYTVISDANFAGASAEQSPADWYVNIPIPAGSTAGTSFAMRVTAIDELYRPERGDAPDHFKQFTFSGTVVSPTAAISAAPTIKYGGNALSTTGANISWVPLNAASPLHIEAGLSSGSSLTVKKIEFRVNGVPNKANQVDVVDGQNSSIDIAPNLLGSGHLLQITAAAIDIWGNAIAVSPAASISIGALAPQPAVSGYPNGSSPPIITKGTDNVHYIYTMGPIAAGGSGLFAQPADTPFLQTASNAAMLGSGVGSDTFLSDQMYPTVDGTGVLVIKKDGSAIERVDAIAAIKAAYVGPPPAGGLAKWTAIEAQGISKVALGLTEGGSSGHLFFAHGAATDTSDTAPVDAGGTVHQFGNTRIQQTDAGALAAFVDNASSGPLVALWHPAITGNGLRTFGTVAGSTALSLQVFPGGEMIWEYANSGGFHFLGAAYFDGTNQPITLASAIPYGATTSASANLAANFFVPRPGVIVGRIPSTKDDTQFELLEINLLAATPTFFHPAPYNNPVSQDTGNKLDVNSMSSGSGVNTALNGVAQRSGGAAVFTTSDDRTKVLFGTRDTVENPVRQLYGVWILDLATGTASNIYKSENLLSGAFRPHFVRAASSWTPEQTLTGAVNAVVFCESLPVYSGGITQTYFFRPFFQTYDGFPTTALPSPVQLAPNAYSQLNFLGATSLFTETAAGKAVIYANGTGEGPIDLYQGTFNSTGATRVMRDITGFVTREDKAKILIGRGDGTLFAGDLSNGVSNLQPILGDIVTSQFPLDGSPLFGFTPDGTHAFAFVDMKLVPTPDYFDFNMKFNTFAGSPISFTLGAYYFSGILVTVDLATGARTDWGRAFTYGPGLDTGFLSNAGLVLGNETISNYTSVSRFFEAAAASSLTHTDTKLLAPSTVQSSFISIHSLDGAEVYLANNGNQAASGIVRSDGHVYPTPNLNANQGNVYQWDYATYSPFGAPIGTWLPNWAVVTTGGAHTSYKKFGGATYDPEHVMLTISSGGLSSTPSLQTNLTKFLTDRSELMFNSKGNDGFYYLMSIPGPGGTALKPPVQ
ncbi:MAG: hypothetical protein JST92_24235 [Deltaproteobacteria bacterium]|nr:hypothetical protein [Deltaproteobacteria bacterium]